jgi:hypothetical protein
MTHAHAMTHDHRRLRRGVVTLALPPLLLIPPILASIADRHAEAVRQREAVREIETAGGFVVYSIEDLNGAGRARWTTIPSSSDRFFVSLVGKDYLSSVREVDVSGLAITPRLAKSVSNLPFLKELHGADCNLHDAEIGFLAKLADLKALHLGGNPLTGESLRTIAQLSKLELLQLPHTQVHARDILRLRNLKNLKTLTIGDWRTIGVENGERPAHELLTERWKAEMGER